MTRRGRGRGLHVVPSAGGIGTPERLSCDCGGFMRDLDVSQNEPFEPRRV